MTRTHRFLGGLSLGYVYLGLVTVVGLWLTPFLLSRVGSHEYGLWLITSQILGYLTLLDLGVVALVPREAAAATGRVLGGGHSDDLAATLARFRRIVRWQLVPTTLVSALAWWLVASTWPELRWPLAAILIAFVVAFPFRIYHAALQGLQDLAFIGRVQLAAWSCGTGVTIALVVAGVGLGALASGWVVTQAISATACGVRLRWHFAHAWPAFVPAVPWAQARELFRRSTWVSVAQVGQVLMSGSDLLVLGALLGPAAAVPYACTGKLVSVLANHPQLLMQTAAPALAELRASAARTRLLDVALALMRAMLAISGAVACLVLTLNAAFVNWWVGPSQYAGGSLTAVLVLTMLLRHVTTTMTYTLFTFGYERRISVTVVVDGLLTLAVTAALAGFTDLGVISAALGSLAGVVFVSAPLMALGLARELGVRPWQLVLPLRGWALRFAIAALLCVVGAYWLRPSGITGLAWGGVSVALIYGVLMLPLALEPPLDVYVRRALEAVGLSAVTRRAAVAESQP